LFEFPGKGNRGSIKLNSNLPLLQDDSRLVRSRNLATARNKRDAVKMSVDKQFQFGMWKVELVMQEQQDVLTVPWC
jgi:hypothetical protein